MTDPQDTTYGSDADLLEERGHMWKARAEKAERERDYFKNLCVEGGGEMRRRLDGAAQVGADALARMHAAETDLANLRAKYDGAMEVDRTEIAACAEKIATLERALADERQTRAALEAQIVTLRGAAEIADAETARWRHEATRMTEEAATLRRHSAAAVLREREECALIAMCDRHHVPPGPHAPSGLWPASLRGDGGASENAALRIAAAIRARSK